MTVMIVPAPAPASPASFVESFVSTEKYSGEIESETEIPISGRTATKIVKRLTAGFSHPQRMVKVFCATDDGVLSLQVSANEEHVAPLMPQIDAIIASLEIR